MVQRVVFLHEELMKLPFFPRKALESDLDLYQGGVLGKVSENGLNFEENRQKLSVRYSSAGIIGLRCAA